MKEVYEEETNCNIKHEFKWRNEGTKCIPKYFELGYSLFQEMVIKGTMVSDFSAERREKNSRVIE